MQASEAACKLMELHASLYNYMQLYTLLYSFVHCCSDLCSVRLYRVVHC